MSRFLPLALVLAFLGALYFATIRPYHNWGGDFSVHLEQARNFVAGVPYDRTTYVRDPESLVHQPSPYPPLFSLLLAPAYALFGLNYVALKAIVQAMLLLSLPFYYAVARLRGLGRPASLFVMVTFGCSGVILDMKETLASESPYLLFSGAALALILWLNRSGKDNSRPWLSGLAVAVLLLMAYATRAAGLALILAFGLHEIWTARRVRAFGAITAMALASGLVVYTVWVYDSRQYANEFPVNWSLYVDNILSYLRTPASLWAGARAPLRYPLTALSLGLVFSALLRRTFTRPTILEFYTWITAALVILLSAGRTARYLVPVFPLYCIYLVEGAQHFIERFLSQHRKAALAGFYGLYLLGTASNIAAIQTGPIPEGVGQPTFTAVREFIAAHTGADDVLMSWNPRVFAFYTRRRSALYPHTGDPVRFATEVRRLGGSHLIVYRGDEDRQFVDRYLAFAHPPEIYWNEDFRIYLLR